MIPMATEAAAQNPDESDDDLDAKAQAAANKLFQELARLPLVVAEFDACATVFALEPPYGGDLYFLGVSAKGVPDEVLDSECITVLIASDALLLDGPGTTTEESDDPDDAWHVATGVAARKLINALTQNPDAMKAFADASSGLGDFQVVIRGGVPEHVIAWGTEFYSDVHPAHAPRPPLEPTPAPPAHGAQPTRRRT